MNSPSPDSPLLTMEQAKAWLAERDEAAARAAAAQNELSVAERRLDALALLFPDLRPLVERARATNPAPAAVGTPPAPASHFAPGPKAAIGPKFRRSNDGSAPLTQVCVEILAKERGGRTIPWIREQIMAMPDQRVKVGASATGLNTSLTRLVGRGMLSFHDGLYYHPKVLQRINAGEWVEERVENPQRSSFAQEMARVFDGLGGRGVAADVVAAARADSVAGPMIQKGAANVYRWLAKQISTGYLVKDGDIYRLSTLPPSERNGLFHKQEEESDVRLNGWG